MNETIEYQNYPKENRNYKDTVFKRAFAKKKDLLDLYNAVNGTHYSNEEDLIINTLQDAVYMCVKNDVSFIVDCRMNLYEHQSSVNPNMPLRGLLYFSKMYETYVELRKIDECIEKGVLRDILEKQKAEVVSLVLTTFNKELYESNLKKDAHAEGYSEGRDALLEEQVKKKLAKGKSVEVITDELEEDEKVIRKVIDMIKLGE